MNHSTPFPVENDFSVFVPQKYYLCGTFAFKYPKCKKTAILCHGIYSNRHHPLLKQIANILPINSIRFDFHGNGESEGDSFWDFGGYLEEARNDIRTIVEYARKDLNLDVVLLLGHSRAATSVLLYAECFQDIPLIACLSGRFNLEEGIQKYLDRTPGNEDVRRYISERDFSSTNSEDQIHDDKVCQDLVSPDGRRRIIKVKSIKRRLLLAKEMPQIMKRINNAGAIQKILLIHGTDDLVVPLKNLHACSSYLDVTKKKAIEIMNADHSLTNSETVKNSVMEAIFDFVQEESK